MKDHESKMPRMEDILSLPVQDPPYVEFSAAHLNWVKVEGGRQGGDDIALIPFARVDDFVKGESSNAECPARFRIESRRKRPEGSLNKPRVDGYLEYTLYWCSYGPEDYRDSESGIGENSSIKPASGKGSRPGRRHMMRGCLCHFTIKRLYTRPLLALIIYNQRNHVDKTGAPCHGILDQEAVGTRAMYAPRISEELRQKVMSMLHVGISLDTIIQHHIEQVQRHGGPHNRDDFLTRNDVRNMERIIHKSSHELHANDKCSVMMWVQRHRKHVFHFPENSGSEPFILGIQTDWQLQKMLRYGHNASIAFHSAYSSKKFEYALCSLLVFDSSQNPIPVAWVITSSSSGQSIHKWMSTLVERTHRKDPRWRPCAILVDDPSVEASVIREAFQCRVLLSLWHVRRGWLKSLLKNCSNFDVQREMFKHIGRILYCSKSGRNVVDAVEEFMQIYVDQYAFIEHFRSKWLPKIELWVNCVRTLPVANQEPYASIELCTFPDVDVLLDEENLEFAKVVSQADSTVAYTIWNPGSEFALCDCSWSMVGNICKHVIKVAIFCRSRQVARPLLAAQVYRQVLLSLLENMPDDPLVLEHAVSHVTRLQQDIKSLEELSNSGLLQPLHSDTNFLMPDNLQTFQRLH
ncbi:zinc ion binding [Abeliophyllum distichum]|uniref:Zinc ion binding n=1 Tax=Abeliophyllum distichum TaxID=126358 RepID=A0ABD1UM15_9LAMI